MAKKTYSAPTAKKTYSAPTAKKTYSKPKASYLSSYPTDKTSLRHNVIDTKSSSSTVGKPKNFANKYQATSNGLSIIIGICVLILVFAYILRYSTNNQASVPLFSSLLNRLSTISSGQFSFDLLGQIESSWIVDFGFLGQVSFDWLRVAINAILSALSIFYWLGQNLVYIFRFFFEIVRWLLVG